MQPSAGPESFPPPRPDLPHTRSRPLHWIVTGTALAALLAASSLLQPSTATARPPVAVADAPASPQAPLPAAAGPDAGKARYPVDCGPEKIQVIRKGAADLDGDGRTETVAVVRCSAGMGTPPSGIYVLAHGAGRPRIVETFLDPREGMSVTDFAVRGRTVSATLAGYSSNDVPRCCPDRQRKVEWHWNDGKFELVALPVAGSV
ncbi:hypothetical protein ACFYYR_08755 [Streptomyces sp. NPDC001922]|uniref:hypothetical protein n=1 Tax=Streptomyces sp. NPDC001922 TaxID=3364624 RepID=UPI0036A460E5